MHCPLGIALLGCTTRRSGPNHSQENKNSHHSNQKFATKLIFSSLSPFTLIGHQKFHKTNHIGLQNIHILHHNSNQFPQMVTQNQCLKNGILPSAQLTTISTNILLDHPVPLPKMPHKRKTTTIESKNIKNPNPPKISHPANGAPLSSIALG